MKENKILATVFENLLSYKAKKAVEKTILLVSIFSFLLHLFLIYLVQHNFIFVGTDIELFKSPIAAIYTPFSFILIYEVYLLVYYIPKSVTTYVSKQYEIITLIVIRRLFKDMADLKLTQDWLNIESDRQFTYDIVLSVLVFYIIYLFKNNVYKQPQVAGELASNAPNYDSFIQLKKIISVLLMPVLAIIASYSLLNWSGIFSENNAAHLDFKNINNIFFEDFFTILIIVDVFLLLISFFYSDSFHKVIRNSGFIISTILIRLSFSTEGLVNNILILSSILFGLLMLVIHNQFEKKGFYEQKA
jgi:hypothetical protein